MFTTVAWSESLDAAGAFAKIAAASDQSLKTSGDSIYVNKYNRLLGAMACLGNTVPGECRILSPSIRRLNPIYVDPVIDQIYPTTYPENTVHAGAGLVLDIDEQLEVEASSNPAAAEQHTVIAWLSDAEITKATGQIFTANAEATMALVAGAWAFSELSFVDDLPVGTYDVVGMLVIADEGVAARLVPVGGDNRPGVPCVASAMYEDFRKQFRAGNMGVFCTFSHNNPPGLEIIGSAAEASDTYQVYLDLIKRS